MAFLDNSGDIILDAVLTDLGRLRMAESRFQIQKFGIGDDEIDYGLYNLNHPSGSAYYDLEILQTPVFEAFTNNTSTMKSNLMSLNRDVLYLPVLKPNTKVAHGNSRQNLVGVYLVVYDQNTLKYLDGSYNNGGNTNYVGDSNPVLNGFNPSSNDVLIAVDQGLDSPDLSPASTGLMSGLVENQYLIDIDRRLGKITKFNGRVIGAAGSGDDDHTAQYIIQDGSGPNTFIRISSTSTNMTHQAISGPRGTRIKFKIQVSENLAGNDSLLTKLGKVATDTDLNNMFGQGDGTTDFASDSGVTGTYKYIDTTVRVHANSTGYAINIPIRFIKKTA